MVEPTQTTCSCCGKSFGNYFPGLWDWCGACHDNFTLTVREECDHVRQT